MKRGDYVKCKKEEGDVMGILLSVDSPSCLFWNEYSPRKITIVDFEGVKHSVELWSPDDVEFIKA